MSIFNKRHLAPAALFVFVACCHCVTLGAADDGLISQDNCNPLQLDNKAIPQRLTPIPQRLSPVPHSGRPALESPPQFTASSAPLAPLAPVYTNKQVLDVSDAIAENVLQFGHNMGLYLSELDVNAENSEIFSPLSVMSALSLLTLGARGRSYQELKHLLGFDYSTELANKYHEEFGAMLDDVQHYSTNQANSKRPRRKHAKWRDTERKTPNNGNNVRQPDVVEHTISVANGVFVQSGYSLNPNYIQIVKSVYDSEIISVDYQRKSGEAREYINSWVSSSTRGKIPRIITDDIDKSTNVILASVLYFRAFWETPFFVRSTNEDNFYPDGVEGKPIRVQMMATGGLFPYYDAKEYDCRIIGLPYKGNETTMYVIQPNNSTRRKLRDLQNVLSAKKINEMIDNMAWMTTIMVFPKMHFTRSLNMKTMLQTMGVRDVFAGGYSDLSLIGGTRRAAVAIPVAAPQRHLDERMQSVFGQGVTARPHIRPLQQEFLDRYDEPALRVTSRFGETDNEAASNSTSASVASAGETTTAPTADENTAESSHNINKRQVPLNSFNPALANLEADRFRSDSLVSDLFVGDILHKVDIAVDEYGTEAAAATVSYLLRSGTDVVFRGDVPFLVVIRHDPTKLPLFYGIINKPEL